MLPSACRRHAARSSRPRRRTRRGRSRHVAIFPHRVRALPPCVTVCVRERCVPFIKRTCCGRLQNQSRDRQLASAILPHRHPSKHARTEASTHARTHAGAPHTQRPDASSPVVPVVLAVGHAKGQVARHRGIIMAARGVGSATNRESRPRVPVPVAAHRVSAPVPRCTPRTSIDVATIWH